MAEGKIKLLVIYEMIGRPPEHIKDSLNELIEGIGKNPGITVNNKKIHEPHPLDKEKAKDLNQGAESLFSTFAEVELVADNLHLVFSLIFNTLPSNIEILEPSELILKNFDLSQVLAQLTIKLHQFDEIAKALTLERTQLIDVVKKLDEKLGGGYVKFGSPEEIKAGGGKTLEVKEEKPVEGKKEEKIGDLVGGSDEEKGEENESRKVEEEKDK
jgi:hypothetical protein